MKIRKKNTTEAYYELAEESPRFFLGYYLYALYAHPPEPPVALPKSEYELVPEEVWENVTGEIEVRPEGRDGRQCSLYRHGHWINTTMIEGYRFSKTSLWECLPEGLRRDMDRYFADGFWGYAINSLKHTYVLFVQQRHP